MSESSPDLSLLRRYELRLLRCTLLSPPPPPNPSPSDQSSPPHPLSPLIASLLTSIESGRYLDALTSADANRLLFKLADSDSLYGPDRVYSELLRRVESFISEEDDNDKDKAYRVVVVLCVAVAALLAFTQSNLTGPSEGFPRCPLPVEVALCDDEWDNWARNQLMAAGSDLLGKVYNVQYIIYAKILVMKMKDLLFEGSGSCAYGIRSLSWWLARVTFLHQRILDDRSSSLFDLLHVYTSESLNHFGTLEKVTSYWGSDLCNGEGATLVSVIHLEAGMVEYIYARVDSCRLLFDSAEAAAGLKLSVTGVLGFRTIHQVEPKAQMVLLADTTLSKTGPLCPSVSPSSHIYDSISSNDTSDQPSHEASDILLTPRLVENESNSGIISEGIQVGGTTTDALSAIHQAVILAKCLLIEKSTRHDEMQRWEMAPYIEAIDSQLSSNFIIRRCCDALRIRWESTRSHTKERALMMMESLVQGINKLTPGVAERIPFCYGIYNPTISALRKEYGELCIRCGLVGEAVKIFEDLELWDNLIFCYSLMEKKAAAVELIKTRLSVSPNDPRLWCSLGDVTNDDACFKKALEVSNDRSARAKRSLARSAYNRGEYRISKLLWESAMALNSLFPDGWFALGAAALKDRDIEKALDGFTRAVQLDPENGEAWNNVACLHMIKGKSKEAFIAFREALKFKRNSYQLWENYSHVALDVGNISQALEATRMVLDLTNNKRIDTELLERIMTEVESMASHNSAMTDNKHNVLINGTANAESEVGNSREAEHLVEFLGKVLQQIVRSGNGADIWGLYARWQKMKGDLAMCREAWLKQVRSYQGSDLWKDRDRFKKFAKSSLELCKVHMEISSSTGSHDELLSAERHLRNIIKQAGNFSDMEELQHLKVCLDEVKLKIDSKNVSA
ncbi:uncharacterized protein LOC126803890 isoform X7 [Argentina anserina]|uniref:uncharacterized protein LOC126803890 isoform X1 n=1 Tax=Argentina anserina TaxID=57926 RepID=UPI002176440E|nr:uncharacterized protein LOC126803890 isoform X1 [Potentilla anserina]XP_050387565.1 uncharacterized protein LOC126803890 isoform X2 [Potentilla anserina]XP_050387566.1 uncharacterized protein LOC126803890 isoform X3 [Potentilla anserina]XP_050387567.1 uncharacterized protein LOC126803890 isoform X4 [Potentilla anserina]XP_050387568.1 uncharacterized protein LOC126803890 isoform X5 [Potentilla anserina]XP_050387569.1 uncharacterized protein LOC126803890 isoform X6 [Potentilla anserina]XP_05